METEFMKTKFKVEGPENVELTMELTMTVRHWREIKTQLGTAWPSSELYSHISSLINQVEQEWCFDNETPPPEAGEWEVGR